MKTLPYILTDSTITVIDGFVPKTVDNSHPNFNLIRDRLVAGEFEGIGELFTIIKAVKAFCGGKIEIDVDTGSLTYGGREIHGSLVDRILQMMKEGFDINPLVKFLDNLMQNPSMRAVQELYKFLEHGKMPITEDGCFLAYKRVRNDYKSVHDGKTDNSIGTIVEMPRNAVDEDSNRTCSYGLHFCSHEYLKSFSGDKVVVLKINPADVVAIPADYNDTKGRACKYEVVGELSEDEVRKALAESIWDTSVVNDYDADDADNWDVGFEDGDVDLDDDFTDEYNDGFEAGKEDYYSGNHPVYTYDTSYTEFSSGYCDGWTHASRND